MHRLACEVYGTKPEIALHCALTAIAKKLRAGPGPPE